MSDPVANPLKLAIFASGRGTNFCNILQHHEEGKLPGVEPVVLVCDSECHAAAIARAKGFHTHVILPSQFLNKSAYESEILEIMREYGVEFIALAGYMRMVGKTLLEAFPKLILNLHPSLLPLYPGKNSIYRAYLDRVKESGVTVHIIDEGMDTGPILIQKTVPLSPGTTLDEFEAAIHAAEHEIFPQALINYAREVRKE